MRLLKLTVFLLLPCLFKSRLAYCQSIPLITLTEKNASLQKVLDDIHQQCGFTYSGDGDWPLVSRPVSFAVRHVSLGEVLELCFRDQPLSYELNIADRYISVKVRQKEERMVHGWVYDENREPIGGVTIHAVGEGDAVSKDNGEFTIGVHYSGTRLSVSMVAYEDRKSVV